MPSSTGSSAPVMKDASGPSGNITAAAISPRAALRDSRVASPIAQGRVVRTIREAVAAVASRQGLVMLPKRAGSYDARPGISFMEIDLLPTPSALACAGIINEILVRLARQYGTMP